MRTIWQPYWCIPQQGPYLALLGSYLFLLYMTDVTRIFGIPAVFYSLTIWRYSEKSEFDRLIEWSESNSLPLKWHLLVLKRKLVQRTTYIKGIDIDSARHIRDLGVQFCYDLKFDCHTQTILSKSKRNMRVIIGHLKSFKTVVNLKIIFFLLWDRILITAH